MPRRTSSLFPTREELLAYVASLYYQRGWDQARIARRLGLSRSMVSRLLSEARRKRIVQIHIQWPVKTVPHLESQLMEAFSLQGARVLDAENSSYRELLGQLGKLAALEVLPHLRDGMTVAVTWGATLWEVVQALPSSSYPRPRIHGCGSSSAWGPWGDVSPVIPRPSSARWRRPWGLRDITCTRR
jgi:deoxyribonucleoside regulator